MPNPSQDTNTRLGPTLAEQLRGMAQLMETFGESATPIRLTRIRLAADIIERAERLANGNSIGKAMLARYILTGEGDLP